MKRSEVIHKRRYLAKVSGRRTIVKTYVLRGSKDLLCRDERTRKTIRLSSRRLWRPAMDDERWDDETISSFDYRTQVAMWDGQDVCLPAIADLAEPSVVTRQKSTSFLVSRSRFLKKLNEHLSRFKNE